LRHNAPGVCQWQPGPGSTGFSIFHNPHRNVLLDDKLYCFFGNVTEGQDVVDAIAQGDNELLKF
jgi:cyclophilin family peptidyl-prolyl cis-trans isomerase